MCINHSKKSFVYIDTEKMICKAKISQLRKYIQYGEGNRRLELLLIKVEFILCISWFPVSGEKIYYKIMCHKKKYKIRMSPFKLIVNKNSKFSPLQTSSVFVYSCDISDLNILYYSASLDISASSTTLHSTGSCPDILWYGSNSKRQSSNLISGQNYLQNSLH